MFDGGILARRIHGLKYQEHRPAIVRIENILQLLQVIDAISQQSLGHFLVKIKIVALILCRVVFQLEALAVGHAIAREQFFYAQCRFIRLVLGLVLRAGFGLFFVWLCRF